MNEADFSRASSVGSLFNHSAYAKLVASVTHLLSRSKDILTLVFFTSYRPWLLKKNLYFLKLAEESGLKVAKVVEKVLDKVMFEHDPGVSHLLCLDAI